MWPFCGAEHLALDTPNTRWRTGYQEMPDVSGFDLDRWVWRRKKTYWNKHMHIVAPSRWMAECVKDSDLMKKNTIHVIPNALDTDTYKPMEKSAARCLLNLPRDRKLILFGAIRGTQLAYKGWDLLVPALIDIAKKLSDTDVVIFGQGCPESPPDLPLKIHWMGHLYDDYTLTALYSAADLLVIPSRQESFGQTGTEAQACGCPVVAFDATGLKDVVSHEMTGLLVKPYDSSAMASAIITLLSNQGLANQYGSSAQKRARHLWSFPVVAKQYSEVYEEAALS
jgi:glycosyltransferase involved in cell wall biosynthesis